MHVACSWAELCSCACSVPHGEMSSIVSQDKSVLSGLGNREEWSKTLFTQPEQDETAEAEQAAAPKVVTEVQAIQTPREVQEYLSELLPPVQHKRGRPIDNIRRKVTTKLCQLLLTRPEASGSSQVTTCCSSQLNASLLPVIAWTLVRHWSAC